MIYRIGYYPGAIREYKKLHPDLQNRIKEVIELLKNSENHLQLKVHKLQGKLKNHFSCSVDYSNRIVFYFAKIDNEIRIIAIGSHDIYK